MTKYNNPIIIKKDTSPYLNLAEYSGIISKNIDDGVVRGIKFPINSGLNENFNLISIQFWVRYPELLFTSSMPIITITNESSSIEITAIPDLSQQRCKLEISTGASIYQNGHIAKVMYWSQQLTSSEVQAFSKG